MRKAQRALFFMQIFSTLSNYFSQLALGSANTKDPLMTNASYILHAR